MQDLRRELSGWLADLSEARAISGQEGEVREILAKIQGSAAGSLKTDSLGNLLVRKSDGKKARLMLAAHMDEVGMAVSWIDKSGFLRFRKAGGIDDRVLVSKSVEIGKDKVPGVIGSKPIHLQERSERAKPMKAEHLMIDIGVRSKEEAEKAVKLGDMVTFDTRFEPLSDSSVKGKAFDDRAGCAILSAIMREEFTDVEVWGAFTVQEEIGVRGARVAAYALEPTAAIVIEATLCSDTPGSEPHEECSKMGSGPVITLMDRGAIADRQMVDELVNTAEAEGIPYQIKRTTAGGNDAASIHIAKGGIRTSSVSVPCRYIHSPCSVMSLEDLENCERLIVAYIRRVEKGECLKR